MALKAILTQTEFDGLGEHFKAEYKQDGERFTLDVLTVEGFALEDVRGLKTALSTERTHRSGMEKILKAFNCKEKKDEEGKVTGWEFGDWNPATVKTSLEKLVELEKIDPKSEAGKLAEQQVEAMRKQLKEGHEKELADKDTAIGILDSALDTALVDNAITSALADGEVKGNKVLLNGVMRDHVKRVEKDGTFYVQVVDANGVPRIGKSTDPMTPKEFALELKGDKQYAGAFEGSGHSGGGGAGGGEQKKGSGEGEVHGLSRIQRGLRDPRTVAAAAPATPDLTTS